MGLARRDGTPELAGHSSPSMRIRFIKAKDTWPLRQLVLRPGQPIEECDFPNDRNPDSFHLGVERGSIIAIGSFYGERHDALKGWKQYRLRGMAVHPDFRGKGAGAMLMRFGISHLKDQRADLLWCNARENATSFYKKLGFAPHGEPFLIEGIGMHEVLYLRL